MPTTRMTASPPFTMSRAPATGRTRPRGNGPPAPESSVSPFSPLFVPNAPRSRTTPHVRKGGTRPPLVTLQPHESLEQRGLRSDQRTIILEQARAGRGYRRKAHTPRTMERRGEVSRGSTRPQQPPSTLPLTDHLTLNFNEPPGNSEQRGGSVFPSDSWRAGPRASDPQAASRPSHLFTLTRVSARTEDAQSHVDGQQTVMAVQSKCNG